MPRLSRPSLAGGQLPSHRVRQRFRRRKSDSDAAASSRACSGMRGRGAAEGWGWFRCPWRRAQPDPRAAGDRTPASMRPTEPHRGCWKGAGRPQACGPAASLCREPCQCTRHSFISKRLRFGRKARSPVCALHLYRTHQQSIHHLRIRLGLQIIPLGLIVGEVGRACRLVGVVDRHTRPPRQGARNPPSP